MKFKWGKLLGGLALLGLATLLVMVIKAPTSNPSTAGLLLLAVWVVGAISFCVVTYRAWELRKKLPVLAWQCISITVIPFLLGICIYLWCADNPFLFNLSVLGFGFQMAAATLWLTEALYPIYQWLTRRSRTVHAFT